MNFSSSSEDSYDNESSTLGIVTLIRIPDPEGIKVVEIYPIVFPFKCIIAISVRQYSQVIPSNIFTGYPPSYSSSALSPRYFKAPQKVAASSTGSTV